MEMATAEELEWLEMEMERETETEMATAEEHFSPKTSSKRTREDQEHEHEHEEKWLRYSPSQPRSSNSKRGRPLHPHQQQEIRISRFASDIQGHCIPITSPAGHRVYAKLNPNSAAAAAAAAATAMHGILPSLHLFQFPS